MVRHCVAKIPDIVLKALGLVGAGLVLAVHAYWLYGAIAFLLG